MHVRHVARDQGGRAALREPGRIDLLVHVAQAIGPVHDQRTLHLGAFEDIGRVDVLGIERRVLAHQDRVEVAEAGYHRRAAREPVRVVLTHADRVRATEGDAVAQPDAGQFQVMQFPAAALRSEQHRQRSVLARLDVLDRIHDDGDAQGLQGHADSTRAAASNKATVKAVMVSKAANGRGVANMLKRPRERWPRA